MENNTFNNMEEVLNYTIFITLNNEILFENETL
jgi:hypothetical protein